MRREFTERCRQDMPLLRPKKGIIATPFGACEIHSMMAVPSLREQTPDRWTADLLGERDTEQGEKLRKVILVTDDETEAMRIALQMKKMCDAVSDEDWEYDDRDIDCAFAFEDEEAFETCSASEEEFCYAVMDAREYPDDGKAAPQAFLVAEKCWNENDACTAMLFLGIEGANDIKHYINAVACCSKRQVFLHIPSKFVQNVEVQRLIYEHDFCMFVIPEKTDDDYRETIQKLLEGSRFHFCGALHEEDFLRICRQRWQEECCEERIATALDHAAEQARRQGRDEIVAEDFEPLLYIDKKDSWQELMGKVGMDNLKEISKKFIALEMEKKRNPKAGTHRKHMLFFGNPGTGKTTGASMLAKIMAERGIGNGKFVVATRKDLIGKYVGHTAPRIAAMFEEAKGGILFVDEAGFFLQESTGGYVQEALKEFIRYMEICDDVTVVFAMYPKEKKRFLRLDEGLTSRIAHYVQFEDYDNAQLSGITEEMLRERGYQLPDGSHRPLTEYFGKLRKAEKDAFGNARECRKLVDELVLAISLRNADGKAKNPDSLSMWELKSVLDRCYEPCVKQEVRFGFQPAADDKACAVI